MTNRIEKGSAVLYVETVEIQLLDIPRALDELGYQVFKGNLQVKAQGFDRSVADRVREAIAQVNAVCAISYDFSESIAQACLEANIPYISWVYDNPQQELYTVYAQYPTNYIFVFDKIQKRRLEEIGVKNVFYMPLAIHPGKVLLALEQGRAKAEEYKRYEADIGFVGQLYRLQSLEEIVKNGGNAIENEMEALMERCFLKWEKGISMHGYMSQKCVEYFSEIDNHKVLQIYPYATEQFYYEAAVLSRLLANRERVFILNDLAEQYDVRCYTFDKDVSQLSSKVKVMPGAKYDYEVSNVYCRSKINLNITLHCIETGISQRIFDVMAAGGFLISNYQEELEELFVPGEDLILYRNMEELRHYIQYYLEHEEERQRIAKNGQKKVLEYHTFHKRLAEVMAVVNESEMQRGDTIFSLMQKAEEQMALGRWREALHMLRQISTPGEELRMLMQQLERILLNMS